MSKRPVCPDDVARIKVVSDVQMSPCGGWILYSLAADNDKNKKISHVHLANVNEGSWRKLTQGDSSCANGRWSPCGGRIAFISGREDKTAQIYTLPMDVPGEATKLTDLPEGSIDSLSWSPDSQWIAFRFRPTHDAWTQKAAEERKGKGLSTPPVEIDDIWYRLDGDGYFGNQRYAVWLVNVATGESKELYGPSRLDFYSFDWLKDSSGLIVAHSAEDHPLRAKANGQLYRVDLDGNSTMLPGLEKGSKGSPRISPCGEFVAYFGDTDQSHVWGDRNTRLYISPMAGGEQRCLSDSADYCLEAATLSDVGAGGSGCLEWMPDGKSIRVTIAWHGEVQVGAIDVASGEVKVLTSGGHYLAPGTLSDDGKRQAVTYADWQRPNDVAVFENGEFKILTDHNRELLNELELIKPEEIWVDSTDDTKVQAWIMRPATGGKSPGVLEVHGGPHTQYGVGFFHEFQLLCAQGYTVVFSNPRGSKGYGEDFCCAIFRNWGTADWDDVQAVTQWMKFDHDIDESRIGIMGGSYGGYMTNWAIGHSREYKAAITDRCVSNWVSMAGNSDFPLARDEYFGGYAWGSIDKIEEMWRQSPLAYFDQVKTPTLIIHSVGDLRCNVEQGEQVFHALQMQGVPSRFVRYPDSTSHGMSRNGPSDLRIHRLKEIVNWWKKYL